MAEINPTFVPPVIPELERDSPTTFVADSILFKSAKNANTYSDFEKNSGRDLFYSTPEKISTKLYDVNVSDAYVTLNDGSAVPTFRSYTPGINNEEYLANKQSTGDKWANGFVKFLGKTSTAVLGGTLGTVDSVIQGISQGSLEAAYNSDLNKWLDDLNTKLDYNLPNYYTEQEKDAGFFESLGSANFYANDLLGGLSFTAGTIISEGLWAAATGGTSLLAKGLTGGLLRAGRWSTEVIGTTRALKGLNQMKSVSKGALRSAAGEGFAALDDVTRAATINRMTVGKALQNGRFLLTSAGYEAGMEARHYLKESEEQWRNNYVKENGREPSSTEISEFKSANIDAGNAVFGLNLGLVGTSNLAVFGNMLLGKTISPTVSNNFLKRNLFGVGFDKTSEGTFKAISASTKQKIAGRVYGILKAPIMEGVVEEGGQSVISGTAQNYMLNAFDPQKTKDSYGIGEAFMEAMGNVSGKEIGIGAIIGFLGGGAAGNKFGYSQIDSERQSIDNAVKYQNGLTKPMVIQKIIAGNKIQAAQINKEDAQRRNDLTGEIVADRSAQIAAIERDFTFQGVDEGIKDFELALEKYDSTQLVQDLGFTGETALEDADAWKAERLQDYKNLAAEHVKNLQFAEALLGETPIAKKGLDDISETELKRAMAYTLTMGKNMLDLNQTIIGNIKSLVAQGYSDAAITDAIDVDDVLERVDVTKKKQYSEKRRQLSAAQKRLQRLERKYVLAQTDSSEERLQKLSDINSQIIEATSDVERLSAEKEVVFQTLGIETLAPDKLITSDMVDNQQQNISRLKAALDNIKIIDPQRYSSLQKLMVEQDRTIRHLKNYDATIRKIFDPNTRITLLNGWLTSLFNKNKSLEAGTGEFFRKMAEEYLSNTAATYQNVQETTEREKFKNDREVSVEYLQDLQRQVELGQELHPDDQAIYDANQRRIEEETVSSIEVPESEVSTPDTVDPVQALQQKIKEIIAGNEYLTSYFGDDVEQLSRKNPSEDQINRYQNLLNLINSKAEPRVQNIIDRSSGYYNQRKIDIGLSPSEIDELKQLNQILNDWKILSADDNGNSVASLLEMIEKLQTQVRQGETKTTQEDKDYRTALETPEILAKQESNSRGIQTPTTALVTSVQENFVFSHIGINTLQSFFPNSVLSLEGQTRPLSESEFNRVAKTEGTKFTITTEEGVLSISVNNRAGLVVNRKTFEELFPISNIKIKNFGGKNTAMQIHQRIDDDTYIPVKSDFDFQSTNPTKTWTIDQNAVNGLQNDEVLDMLVDLEDAYNVELLNSDQSDEEKAMNLNIYLLKRGSRSLIGTLTAVSKEAQKAGVQQEIQAIRRKALQTALKAQRNGQTEVKLPQKMEVTMNFIGTPTVILDGEGNTKNQPFTSEMLQNVVGTGFINSGTITSNTKIDVTAFIERISKINPGKSIPFVVFNHGNKTVAFPVDLIKTTVDFSQDVISVLNSELSSNEKANSFLETLVANNIDPKKYAIDFSDTEWYIENAEVDRAVEDLSQVETFADVAEFAAKSYNKANLISDATIAINLSDRPFDASKILIRPSKQVFDDVQSFEEQASDLEEERIKLVEDLNQESLNLYNNFITDPAWQGVTGTHLSDTFDEQPVEEANSFLGKVKNINILREALSKPIRGKALQNIGVENIRELKNMLARYDELKGRETQVRVVAKDSKLQSEINEVKKDC